MRLLATLLTLVLAAAALPVRAADAGLASPIGLWQPLDGSGKPLGKVDSSRALRDVLRGSEVGTVRGTVRGVGPALVSAFEILGRLGRVHDPRH